MSDRDQWEANRRAQNEHLRQQLHALHSGPRSRWREFRLLEVVCRSCGDTVLEVMNTDPYRVVRTWEHQVTKGGSGRPILGQGLSLPEIKQAAYEDAKARTTWTRRGEATFSPIPADWEGDSDHLINTACGCRGHELRGNTVAGWLRSTRRKRLI